MFRIGTGELLLIFLIVFFLFGASKLPEIARALGKAIKEFKKATEDVKSGTDGSSETK